MPRPIARVVAALSCALLLTSCAEVGDVVSGDRTRYVVSGASMEPTIPAGTRVWGSRVDEGFSPARGQVVVYAPPAAWGPIAEALAHRVIGLPGETVMCCASDGSLVLDGQPLVEGYLAEQEDCNGPMVSLCRDDWSVTVPEGHVFLMGDNRAYAADSSDQICPPAAGEARCAEHANDPFVPISSIIAVLDP